MAETRKAGGEVARCCAVTSKNEDDQVSPSAGDAFVGGRGLRCVVRGYTKNILGKFFIRNIMSCTGLLVQVGH